MNHFCKSLLGAALLLPGISAGAATFVGDRTDFRDETIYFAMTTRFYDGDVSNNTYCWDGTKNVNDPEWRGDFKGLIDKLDYIKALGFTAVWITPVVENASGLDYHGYHAFDFSKVDPRYESTDCKFQDLIDAVHARGMKLILDVVFQHTGNFGEAHLCPMFVKDYSANLSNINKSMKLAPNTKLPADYMSMNGDSQYHARLSLMKNVDGVNHDTHNYWHHYAHFNWDDPSRWWGQIAGDCVDLNTENPATSNYIVECYTKFIEMGVDGFRIDTGGHISRLTFNKAFIPQLHAAAEKAKAKRGGTPFFMYTEVCARAEEVIYRGENYNCSPCYYTWKENKEYAWDDSETSWDNYVVMEGQTGDHVNAKSVLKQGTDDLGHSSMRKSNNAFLNGNDYRTEDYSAYSGLSVIDFPMHWRFHTMTNSYGVRTEDNLYNDARWNVVYVDSHDYGPNGQDKRRFDGGEEKWAQNLDLMFTWRGIPCLYYGSEIQFRKGVTIDEGPNLALKDSGRAYFGGYITGSVDVTDFATYSNATGNMAATLSNPLALHIQRLNKIRAAIPALRKGQYSTDGCSGTVCFKRRYVDANTDSYVLVTIGGSAKFTGILNGKYTDAITGDVKNVTDGTLSASCSGSANMRIYVLDTQKTKAPGKVGEDGKYLYNTSSVAGTPKSYDGHEEDGDLITKRDTTDPDPVDPIDPIEPTRYAGEYCAFFENTSNWGSPVHAWVWGDDVNYTGGKWPGANCENLGNNIWKWTTTEVVSEGAGIIFSGNGGQTADMVFTNGGYYKAGSTTAEKVIPVTDGPVPPTPSTETYTVYFDNSVSNWSAVNAYVWTKAGSKELLGSWPGTALTEQIVLDGKTLYTIKVPGITGAAGIIFNNGTDQSGDLDLVNFGVYNVNGLQYSSIAAPESLSMRVYAHNGRLIVESPAEVVLTIATADGRFIKRQVAAGINVIDDLPHGFYIVNNTKVIL